MRGNKLDQLFAAARRDEPPALPATLADDVVRALRREPPPAPTPFDGFEELSARFPRFALVTLTVLALGVVANLALGTQEWSEWGDGLTQVSTQWLPFPNGI